MSYCTVDDVCTAFPRFVRNAANSIQDTQIQDWIDDRKARIRSALYARAIDPDAMALTPDQANFLRALNRDGAIADLADALQGNVSLQAGEDVPRRRAAAIFRAADRRDQARPVRQVL